MSAVPHSIRLFRTQGDFTLDVDLQLPDQGITVLYGPSGSGKTSVLRCVAGLERAPSALVRMSGMVWQDEARGLFVPPWRRALGYVFQEASLFEHLDVRGNLAYGLRRGRRAGQQIALDAAIALLGIESLLQRRVQQLSGGERQRVAIARAVASQPELLLLDEPLAALDHARRQDILPWLEGLRDGLRIPMLYVTHAADEVARLAQTLVVLERGRVRVAGPVASVLAQIETPVALGDDVGALIEGRLVARDERWHLAQVAFDGGLLWLRDTPQALGTPVRPRVLARDVSLATELPRATSIQNLLPCVIQDLQPDSQPFQVLVRLRCGGSVILARITARAASTLELSVGRAVWAQVKTVALVG